MSSQPRRSAASRRDSGAPVCASALGGTDPTACPGTSGRPGGVTQAAAQLSHGTGISSGYTTEQVVTGSDHRRSRPVRRQVAVGLGRGRHLARRRISPRVPPDRSFDAAVRRAAIWPVAAARPLPTRRFADRQGHLRRSPGAVDPGHAVLRRTSPSKAATATRTTPRGGGNSTYKLGLDWQIVPDLRLRGSYERAVRAPERRRAVRSPVARAWWSAPIPAPATAPERSHGGPVRQHLPHTIPGVTVAQSHDITRSMDRHSGQRASSSGHPVPGSARPGRRQPRPEAGNRATPSRSARVHADLLPRLLVVGRLLQHRGRQGHRGPAAAT